MTDGRIDEEVEIASTGGPLGRGQTYFDIKERLSKIADRINDLPSVSHKDVRDLCRDIPIIYDFLTKVHYNELGGDFQDRLSDDEGFDAALRGVDKVLERIQYILFTLAGEGYSNSLAVAIRDAAADLREAQAQVRSELHRVIISAPQAATDRGWRSAALDIADIGADHFQARESLAAALRDSEEARRARRTAQEAAGQTGAATLCGYFESYANAQHRTADHLRIAASLLLVLLSTCAFAQIILGLPTDGANLLLRLSLAIPLVALAGYLARESARHRENGIWAGHLAIKLKTLPAFAESDAGSRAGEYWHAMGVVIFGSANRDEESRGQSDAPLFEHVLGSIERLAGLANRLRGPEAPGSSGEKTS